MSARTMEVAAKLGRYFIPTLGQPMEPGFWGDRLLREMRERRELRARGIDPDAVTNKVVCAWPHVMSPGDAGLPR